MPYVESVNVIAIGKKHGLVKKSNNSVRQQIMCMYGNKNGQRVVSTEYAYFILRRITPTNFVCQIQTMYYEVHEGVFITRREASKIFCTSQIFTSPKIAKQ